MSKYFTMKSFDKETILLPKNQTASLKGKQFMIKCLSGIIWVTWPNGAEQIPVSGQSISGASKGKVCIFAFSNAVVQVKQKKCHGTGCFPTGCCLCRQVRIFKKKGIWTCREPGDIL